MKPNNEKIDELEREIKNLKAILETRYTDKAFLSDSIADVKAHIIERERQIDDKVNIHTAALKRKKFLTEKEEKKLDELKVFSPVYLKDKESWGL